MHACHRDQTLRRATLRVPVRCPQGNERGCVHLALGWLRPCSAPTLGFKLRQLLGLALLLGWRCCWGWLCSGSSIVPTAIVKACPAGYHMLWQMHQGDMMDVRSVLVVLSEEPSKHVTLYLKGLGTDRERCHTNTQMQSHNPGQQVRGCHEVT